MGKSKKNKNRNTFERPPVNKENANGMRANANEAEGEKVNPDQELVNSDAAEVKTVGTGGKSNKMQEKVQASGERSVGMPIQRKNMSGTYGLVNKPTYSDLAKSSQKTDVTAKSNNTRQSETESAAKKSSADKALFAIRDEYFHLSSSMIHPSKRDKSFNILEFQEQVSRLVFRLDDIEVVDDDIKTRRRTLLGQVQKLLDLVREEVGKKVTTEKKEGKENLDTSTENTNEVDTNKSQEATSGIGGENEEMDVDEEAVGRETTTTDDDDDGDDDDAGMDVATVYESTSDEVQQISSLMQGTRINKTSENADGHLAPIQLLVRGEGGMFELNEEAVKTVLLKPEVKNRKICVVSIVGAFRRGKSFLLNFMLRYLNANRHEGWLQHGDGKLEGFSWRGGMDRDTTGILMWPQPFLVGKDLAVILLDTQGTFDNKTSMKENTFIFALSTLLSSVQIYNLFERIQMDDLNNLQYFLEFGRMVQSNCNAKVFEKLIFLIRDWKFPKQRDFGFDGGRCLMNDWMKKDHDSVTKQQTEMIDMCFTDISCYLMPHPGDRVSTDPDFTGMLDEIKPEFVDHLKMFIEGVLHPSSLRLKQVGGEVVTAAELVMYMTNYIEKLQHPDIEPKTLFQSMSDTSHEKAISKAKKAYNIEMEKSISTTKEILELGKQAEKKAIEVFDSVRKFGDQYQDKFHRRKLKQALDELYNRFEHHYFEILQRQTVEELRCACSDAFEQFQASMSAFVMQVNPSTTLEVKFKEAARAAAQSVVDLKLVVSKQKMDCEMDILSRKMKKYYENISPSYRERLQHETDAQKKETASTAVQSALKCYRDAMESHCGVGREVVSDMKSIHAEATNQGIAMLDSAISKFEYQDSLPFYVHFNEECEELFVNYKKQNKMKISQQKQDQLRFELLSTQSEAVMQYRLDMDEKCAGLVVVENLQEIHEAAKHRALALFNPFIQSCDQDLYKSFIDKAKEYIEQTFKTYEACEVEKRKRNEWDKANEMFYKCCKEYDEEMDLVINDPEPVKDLTVKHQSLLSKLIGSFSSLVGFEGYSKVVESTQKKLENRYYAYEKRNKQKTRELKVAKMSDVQRESVQYYQEQMDALNIDVEPVENLEERHKETKKAAVAMFDEFKDFENYRQLIASCEKSIESKWKVYSEKNKTMEQKFKNEHERTALCAYKTTKAEYNSAMCQNVNTNVDIKDMTHLFHYHEKEKEKCIANFIEMVKECRESLREEYRHKLIEDIQQCFEEVEEIYGRKIRDLRWKEEKYKEGAKKSYVVGIDLGTTNCCVAAFKDGNVEIIMNETEKTTTPSVVFFKDSEILFGEPAKLAGFGDPTNCVSEIKRIIGRRYDDTVVQALIKSWGFSVVENNSKPVIEVTRGSKTSYRAEEISGLVLREMKRIAEHYLGTKVYDAVVTIPAYFNELQREATKAACVDAGLNVLRMINEPTAAAIAYGLQHKSDKKRTILVFDFGGGTCDISILTVEGERFSVKASVGDNKLGGEDFDDKFTEYVTNIIEEKYGMKVDVFSHRRLRHNCERVKKNLSTNQKYTLKIDNFGNEKTDIELELLNADFEKICDDLFKRALIPVKECLKEANLNKKQIDEVVLVGGSSRMPKMQKLLTVFFDGKTLNLDINPDEAIAYGAAMQAALSSGEYSGNLCISEITPISLGVGIFGNRMSIITPKQTKIPAVKTHRYHTVQHNQSVVAIIVYQGECTHDEYQNTKIGAFDLYGIRKAPAGDVEIDVTFTIDVNGILHVTAVEVGGRQKQGSITVTKSVV